jgi:hypothetical protein
LVPCFNGLHSFCTYNSYHSFLKSKFTMKVLFSFLQDSNLWFSPYVPNHGLNPQWRHLTNILLFSIFCWNLFYWFSSQFLNVDLVDPNCMTYAIYVINCKKIHKFYDIDCWNPLHYALDLCRLVFFFVSFFIWMDELGMNVLTITMLEDMIFSTISNCHELTFLLSFSTLSSLWDFFN